MAFTKYSRAGGAVSIFPIMEGGMNCGYSIDAYTAESDTPFRSISGTKDDIKPLVFNDASLIPEKTIVMGTFHFRAGNDVLVGGSYTIGLIGKQNGAPLINKATREGTLPKLVKVSQVSQVLITEEVLASLNEEA